MKEETIREIIENADDKKLVYAWNYMCGETDRYDDEIHENEEWELEEVFGGIDSALRAACYGEYRYTDTWFVLNGYGNMDSFSYTIDSNCPIDTDELVRFFMENPEDFGVCFDCDIEDLEENEDEDENDDEKED